MDVLFHKIGHDNVSNGSGEINVPGYEQLGGKLDGPEVGAFGTDRIKNRCDAMSSAVVTECSGVGGTD
jgi:hypothetical protein